MIRKVKMKTPLLRWRLRSLFGRSWYDEDGNCFRLYRDGRGTRAMSIHRYIKGKLLVLQHSGMPAGSSPALDVQVQGLLQLKMKLRRMTCGDLPGDGRMFYKSGDGEYRRFEEGAQRSYL